MIFAALSGWWTFYFCKTKSWHLHFDHSILSLWAYRRPHHGGPWTAAPETWKLLKGTKPPCSSWPLCKWKWVFSRTKHMRTSVSRAHSAHIFLINCQRESWGNIARTSDNLDLFFFKKKKKRKDRWKGSAFVLPSFYPNRLTDAVNNKMGKMEKQSAQWNQDQIPYPPAHHVPTAKPRGIWWL